MTSSRRLAPLPLLLIGLAALCAVLVLPWTVDAQTPPPPPTNQDATGRPVVYPSAEGAGLLLADVSGIADPNKSTFVNASGNHGVGVGFFDFSYQWIRVDGDTSAETNVGVDSRRYQRVDADTGNLIKVSVSFTDGDGFPETLTSLPFGPIAEPAPSLSASTLVSNTGQMPSATANITQQYAMEFHLGAHGQGYELSSVSIDLAAVPSSLTVSLWIGGRAGSGTANKVFDFESPSSFVVGLNEFTAPAGAFAYQNVRYWIVLSDFGSSLSIKETTSDGEDAGGETGAELGDTAMVRALGSTGPWAEQTDDNDPPMVIVEAPTTRAGGSVLRLAVDGSQRASGILASNYAQTGNVQEIVSLEDKGGMPITLGAADRYLIRGFSWDADGTGAGLPIYTPFDLRSGWTTDSEGEIDSAGTKWFSLAPTRYQAGINVWTAPQGATVAGGGSYLMYEHYAKRPPGSILGRVFGTSSDDDDTPTAPGVSLSDAAGDFAIRPLMAFLGEPLYAMAQNLGQTDNSYVSVGGTNKVVTQAFMTGSQAGGYGLLGIGVNIEGSDDTNSVAQLPDDATSVSVSVYTADLDGKPDEKQFDLVSPTEYAPGHSFFEAPAGTTLAASTAFALVWTYKGATTLHRLQQTTSDSEDSGALGGATIADAFYKGADLANLTQDSGGNALEIAVYADTPPRNATGQPVIRASAEGAPYLLADTSAIRDANGLPLTDDSEEGGVIDFVYTYEWIRVDGMTETNIGADSPRYQLVDADYDKLIKVEVSFADQDSFPETVTSDPFRAVRRAADPLLTSATLVSNTGQTASADANIDKQYAQGFTLGGHGQGYELSSVSIELAAVPTALTVSLWIADHADKNSTLESRLYDFKNPATFAVGANEFTAPPGVLLYPNIQYAVVLSGFTSLSIKETTSDAEDTGGETGAELRDKARVRDLGETGRWGATTERQSSASDRETGIDPNTETPVLRLAIAGSKRSSGILASTYGQAASDDQEIISLDDLCCIKVDVGAADRYLIRGFSWNADDSTPLGGGVTNPFELRDGSATGDKLFRLFITRNIAGVPEWSAPQGATVVGGSDNSYFFSQDWDAYDHIGDGTRGGHTLTRVYGTQSKLYDTPLALGMRFSAAGDVSIPQLLAAVLGEPLYAMVQNRGRADAGFVALGAGSTKVLSQAFTTGSGTDGYRLQGIGVNVDGSIALPDDATSVTVSLYTADADGKPDSKLFDFVSPGEYARDHNFFEAPAGTTLAASTTYVMVWRHNSGTRHRLRITTSNSEDSGAFGGATIANAYYFGAGPASVNVNSNGYSLEIAVYTDSTPGTLVYTDISPGNATGLPVVLASAEGGGAILAADTSRLADEDGLPYTGSPDSGIKGYVFSYQWIRVDGETEVGTNSQRYQLVDADYGKLIKVQVSFVDRAGNREVLDSLPFGPIVKPPPSAAPRTLVGNTGQTPSAAADISGDYAMGFRLGKHGQGYEISSVEIDLAAAPPTVSVSLWNGGPRGSDDHGSRTAKLFDFENPSSLQVGLNKFTAPAGAFAYQNLNYWIVLSDFGDSLSIKETTSDAEDAGGETGAILFDEAGGDSSVLRLAVEGSQRASGILASNYAQPSKADTPHPETGDPQTGDQEIISVGDKIGWAFGVGAADRYLVRGVTFAMDDTTSKSAGFINPFWLRSDSLSGDRHFDLVNTRDANGTPVWTAPQGATVAGGCTTTMEMGVAVVTCEQYVFDWADINVKKQNDVDRIGAVLTRIFTVATDADGQSDDPTAPGVSLAIGNSVTGNDAAGPTPLMAVHGEPLVAMVQNLGQTDNGYLTVGSSNSMVASQGFTTGSDPFEYRLQGVGVNVEGSDDTNMVAQVPDDSASVSVSVYTDSNGKPSEKLFDLVSPTEFAAGHSFFEAPPGTYLTPNTSYVLVWSHTGGTLHRLQRTAGNSEDSGARSGASIADAFYSGSSLNSLSQGGHALEIAVYTEVGEALFVPGDHPEVTHSWLHIPDGVNAGYQFRVLFVTRGARDANSGDIEDYNGFVQAEAGKEYNDPVIRGVSKDIKAVVCTAAVDAPTNTGMPTDTIGVPVHWLDGGWEDRPTLIAYRYAGFYGDGWVNSDYGAYATGNSAHFHENAMVWTGCDASGAAHPSFPMGATSPMGVVAVGTPNDSEANHAPLGAVDVGTGQVTEEIDKYRPLYAISPIFTVVGSVGSFLTKPQNVTGTASGGTVTLRWDPPEHDGGQDVTGYRVYWRNSANGNRWENFRGVMLKADVWAPGIYTNRGYHQDQADSSLSATTFEYGGVTYTVQAMLTQKRTDNARDVPDLFLTLSPIPTAAALAALTLEIPSTGSFALDDEDATPITDTTADTTRILWEDVGAIWSDGQRDFFYFKDADGTNVSPSLQVDADTTTWTDVNDRNRTYGVAAVSEAGESGRALFLCTTHDGCRPPLMPVVKISADSPLVPSGLRSRDRFRLIFLSSTERNAESTDIAEYNKFVQDRAAAGHSDIRAHSAGFRAVACTEAVDARDNTGTNGIGLGIHWLGGAKAVDNYVDFYDGSWDEEVTVRDESGAAVTIGFANSANNAWTGCGHAGTEGMNSGVSIALGTTRPGVGLLNSVVSANNSPFSLNLSQNAKATLNYLYGLSYIFEVR